MKVISLFTGAMGLDIGLERNGFQTVVAVENNRHAQSTIRANRPDVTLFDDAFSVTKEQLLSRGQVDAVVGGPPCQSWSHAGKRLGMEDDRGLCIPRFLDIVDMIRPKIVVMENVVGLDTASIDGKKGAMPKYITERLIQSGYASSYCIVNSADFGSPQCRKRVVFLAVALKDGNATIPTLAPTHAYLQQMDLFMDIPPLKRWRTVRDAIGDRPQGEGMLYPESKLKFFRLLKASQDWRNLPEDMKADAMKGAIRSGGGRTGFFRRLPWDKPCPTLTCSPVGKANAFCHPDEDRPLNVIEYARIQGFPDDWKFMGPLAERYKQIGNAVPLELATAIGKAISKQPTIC